MIGDRPSASSRGRPVPRVLAVDVEKLVAAGLYDPGSPAADDRLDLLQYLHDAGATVEDMVEADADGNLTSLAFDLQLRRGELSATDLAQGSAMPLERVLETYRLLGITVPDPTAPLFVASEARLLELLASEAGWLPEGMGDEILQSIGSALTIVAESAVSAFVGSVEDLLVPGSQRTRAELTTATGELGLELGTLMGPLFRHHLWSAVRRQRTAMLTALDRRESKLSVGFVDLVGFTPATAAMSSAELLEFMRRFHRLTYDVVTRSGGRVVKHIGDEIMFTTSDPAAGCEIAVALVEAFDDADSLPRSGLAHGMVVARHGDYYGPIVNLASRLTEIAVTGEVLADAALTDAATGDQFELVPAGRRQLKGIAEPVSVVSIRRARVM